MVQMDDESSRTLWCGNLHEKVTEELLYELFLQAGPLEKVKLVSQPNGVRFAFITFKHALSVPYTINLMNGIRLFDRTVRLQTRTGATISEKSGSSCPGTPITPARPSLLLPNPSVVQYPMNVLTRMGQPLHLSASPGYMLPPKVAAVVAQQQHPGFNRSYSVPEFSHSGGKMLHGMSGLVDDQRSPYARPVIADRSPYQRQRDQYCASPDPSNSDAVLMAQLQAIRQMSNVQADGSKHQRHSDVPSQSRQYHADHHQHYQHQQRGQHDSRHGSYSSSSRHHR